MKFSLYFCMVDKKCIARTLIFIVTCIVPLGFKRLSGHETDKLDISQQYCNVMVQHQTQKAK